MFRLSIVCVLSTPLSTSMATEKGKYKIKQLEQKTTTAHTQGQFQFSDLENKSEINLSKNKGERDS